MKHKNEVCVLVQARLGSQRVPQKMIRPFCGSSLTEIVLKKLTSSSIIPTENVWLSAFESELKKVGQKCGVNIYDRSEKSANSEGDKLSEIYEWHNKLNYKYVVLVSGCNPLLKIQSIDKFYNKFLNSSKQGAFAVFEKKTYYWDVNGKSITDWNGLPIMDTKRVDPIYEAAHCLYASRMDYVNDGFWMDNKCPAEPELIKIPEIEAFDIDYEWQFELAQTLYKNAF